MIIFYTDRITTSQVIVIVAGASNWLYTHFKQVKLGLTVKKFISNGLEISFLGKKS